MAATWSDDELNAMADFEASRVGAVSVHTANPGKTGAAEAAGGAPAYARKVPTFNAAGAVGPLGATLQPATVGVAWSDLLEFDLPAGTYTHSGLHSAVSAGTFRGGNTLGAQQVLAAQGTIQVSVKVGPFAGA